MSGSFDPNIHVPGLWRCAKCGLQLLQSNLNSGDGTVTARDQAGDKCPNDDAPLWRVTWKEEAFQARAGEMQAFENGKSRGLEVGADRIAELEAQLAALPSRERWKPR